MSTPVLFVMDKSGSMSWDLHGSDSAAPGTRRIDYAKAALAEQIQRMGPTAEMGLIVFPYMEPCDTSLQVPISMSGSQHIMSILPGMDAPWTSAATASQGTGGTPLAGAIDLAGQTAYQRGGNVRVVILTDGEETCGGDPVETARKWRNAGINIEINVIGYVVDEQVRARLSEVAAAGGGRYLDARSADELAAALHTASAQPQFPAPPPQYAAPPPQYPAPPQQQWQQQGFRQDPGQGTATASLVLGIIGLIVFGIIAGIIAIVLGSVSAGQSKRAGFPRRGAATAGVVLGVIDVVSWLVIIVLVFGS